MWARCAGRDGALASHSRTVARHDAAHLESAPEATASGAALPRPTSAEPAAAGAAAADPAAASTSGAGVQGAVATADDDDNALFDAELDAALGAEDAGVAEAGAASREASVEAAGQDLASEQVRQNYLVATIVCCNLLLMFDAHLVQFIGAWLA